MAEDDMAVRVLEMGRYRVRVHSYPRRGTPRGPAAVLLPGMGATGHALGPQIRLLRSLGYTPYAIDLPGVGLPPALRKEDARFPQLADLVISVCAQLGIERAVFVGHSLGGGIALHVALQSPGSVEKLVLFAPAAVGTSLVWLYRLYCIPLLGRALLRPAGGARGPLSYFLLGGDRRGDAHFAEMMFRHSTTGPHPAATMRSLVWSNQPSRRYRATHFLFPGGEQTGFTLRDRLGEIAAHRIPALVLWGAQDHVISVADARIFRDRYPGAQVHVFPRAGHMLPLEAADQANALVRDFVGPPQGSSSDVPEARPSPFVVPAPLPAEVSARRPWVRHYPEGVPVSLRYPRTALDELLRRAAREHPRSVCSSFFGATLDYRTMDVLASRFASALQRLGVGKGDRVALVLPNCPQYVFTHFGALRAGAVVVPCDPTYTADEIERQLRDSGAVVVVALTKSYPAVAEAIARGTTSVRTTVVTNIKEHMPARLRTLFTLFRERKEGHRPKVRAALWLADLLRAASPFPRPVAIAPDDLAVLQYTGGTTGIPKGAMLTHGALIANACQCVAWDPQARPGDGVLALMPFFHVYGLTVVLHTGVLIAGRLILQPKFDLRDLLATIDRERPRLFPGAPRVYVAINEAPDLSRYDLTSIEACLSGSAPLPEDVARRFESISGGRVVEGYGLTEAGPVTHANPLDGGHIGSVGLPVPDVDCKLVDIGDPSVPAAPETPGELCVRGPNLMTGYWGRPDETALVLREGWLHTGDIASMDAEGYFRIVDRKKEMIIVNGLKVFPREVDEVLLRHPAVRQAAVIGIPDRTHGEAVKAFVALRPGEHATSEELRAHCARHLAHFKVPVEIAMRPQLPTSILGKVLRRVLVEEDRALRSASA